MRNLIIKTALITVAIVIAVSTLVCSSIMLFAPKATSNFFYSIGNKKLALVYAEKQYSKSKDILDLENVVVISNESGDYVTSAKYSEILIADNGFIALCQINDNSGEYGMSYFNYVYGNYAVALYKTEAPYEKVFLVADKTIEIEYTPFNAYAFLIYSDIGQTKEFYNALKTKLGTLSIVSADLTYDIETLTQKINSLN